MPSRRMTRPITAAPIQNSKRNAVATAATPPACMGPRITYCASARMVPGPVYLCSLLVAVRIRQQCQRAGTLDSGSQLTRITCFGAGAAAGPDLAGFSDVAFQGVQILGIHPFNTFCRETTELTTSEKTSHNLTPNSG